MDPGMSKPFSWKPVEDALARFEEAVRTHAFRGAQMPGDQERIQNQYDVAKDNLKNALQNVATTKYQEGFQAGRRDSDSRRNVSPGNGDMGG